jgi:lipoprotein NlpD
MLPVLLVALLLAGCGTKGLAPVDDRGYGPAPPGFYRIRSGDTLSEIAERERISMRKLAAWNDLGPPYPLYAGQLLRVKAPRGGSSKGSSAGGSTQRVAARSSTAAKSGASAAASAAKPGSSAAASGLTWTWPASGPLAQRYHPSDRTRQGVRIAAAAGSPVSAAADGEVVYSGSSGLAGYGNLIIVKHNPRYLSAYGFNRRVLVSEGARVKRGQQLAEVGQSAAGQPMLHFEIRRDGATVDPLLFLPAAR